MSFQNNNYSDDNVTPSIMSYEMTGITEKQRRTVTLDELHDAIVKDCERN